MKKIKNLIMLFLWVKGVRTKDKNSLTTKIGIRLAKN